MELRRGRDLTMPRIAQRGRIEPVEQQQPALRRPQSGQDIGERRLAAARGPLDQDAVARGDREVDAVQHRGTRALMTVPQGTGLEHRSGTGPAASRAAHRPTGDRQAGLLGPGSGTEDRRHLLPGKPCARQARQPATDFAQRALRQHHSAETDRQRGRAGRGAAGQRRGQRGQCREPPTDRQSRAEAQRGAIHVPGCGEVARLEGVLAAVAALRALLRQPGAMADHRLDQIIGQAQPAGRPGGNPPVELQPHQGCQHRKAGQQRGMEQWRGAEMQHPSGKAELDQPDQHRKRPAQRQAFERLRFHDLADHPAHPAPLDRIGGQSECPGQQAGLEQPSEVEREHRFAPAGQQAAGQHRQRQQQPGREPAPVEPAGDCRAPDQLPAPQLRAVKQHEQPGDLRQPSVQPGMPGLPREVGAGRKPQQGQSAHRLAADPLVHHRRADPGLPRRRDPGGRQHAQDFGAQRIDQIPRQQCFDRFGGHPQPLAGAGHEQWLAPALPGQRKEAGPPTVRHAQDRGAAVREETAQVAHGAVDRDRLDSEPRSGPVQPVVHRVFSRRRTRPLRISRGRRSQPMRFAQRGHRLAQFGQRPPGGIEKGGFTHGQAARLGAGVRSVTCPSATRQRRHADPAQRSRAMRCSLSSSAR